MPKKFEVSDLTYPEIKESSVIYQTFFTVCRDRLFRPETQHDYDYHYVNTQTAGVVVLAQTSCGQLVVVEEYRHPVRTTLMGLPGGYLDGEETPETAARRELLEETGFSAETFALIGSTFPYPGISSQKLYFVVAKGAYQQMLPKPEATELLRTHLMTHEEIQARIKQGAAVDGIMCTALYLQQHSEGI